jgi:hypothetical protein
MEYEQTLLQAETTAAGMNLGVISDYFAEATAGANAVFATIDDLLSDAQAGEVVSVDYTPGSVLDPSYVPSQSVTVPDDLSLTEPEFYGEVPDLQGLSIQLAPMPEPTFSKPALWIPDAPDVTWPQFAAQAPQPSAISFPSAPSISLPSPPSIEDVIIPGPPELANLEFTGKAPDIDLTPPEIVFSWSEESYTTALVEAIKSRLEADLHTGGDGYTETVEDAMYDREEARQQAEDEKAYQEALEAAAARGFIMPPGQVNGTLIEISDGINKRRQELSAKLLAEQTELAQKNDHFAIGAAVQIEKVLIKHHSQVQQRSFEAAKFALDAALELYGARVDAYRARVGAYSVLAEVYETRIRAEIVKAELYKAHIEGLKTGIEANAMKIQAYKAQLQGVYALVKVYQVEMQAGHVLAQIERNQVEAYRSRVEVYKTRIEAIQAQYKGYVAQVEGEALKADIVKADSVAYKTHCEAYRARAEVELENARATIEVLKTRLAYYASQVQKFSVDVDFVIGKGKAIEQYAGVIAELRILAARYDGALKDLNAKLFAARSTIAQGIMRAQATVQDAAQSAMVSAAQAAGESAKAASEVSAIIEVATNAADTTNTSENFRQVTSETKYDNMGKDTTQSLTKSLQVGSYTRYRSSK